VFTFAGLIKSGVPSAGRAKTAKIAAETTEKSVKTLSKRVKSMMNPAKGRNYGNYKDFWQRIFSRSSSFVPHFPSFVTSALLFARSPLLPRLFRAKVHAYTAAAQ
jgi:hypothetical protein